MQLQENSNIKSGIKMKLIINTNKKYGLWLKKHLEKEHPKTKNRIKIRRREL